MSRRRNETAKRAVTALVFAAPAAASLALGPPLLPVFVGAIVVVMAWEWLRVTGGVGFTPAGVALAGLLLAAVAAAASGRFAWGLILVTAAVPAIYGVARLRRPSGAPPLNAAAAALGALYIGLPALALLWLYERPEIGRSLVIWLICIVIAADVAAYFVGRAVGGPKLAPRVSPGKTWSGALGGLVGALAVGLGLGLALGLARPVVLAGGAVAFAVVSQIGDLLESGVKRAFKVKDAGGILPGHGGMMDRVDGIIAALAAAALGVWIAGGDVRPWL